MVENFQITGTVLLFFSLLWGLGVMLQVGFEKNPCQPRVSVPKHVVRILTFNAVQGDPVVVPTLFQSNLILCIIVGVVEFIYTNEFPPFWTPRILFAGIVVCGILTQVFNRRK